ncbi:Serine phosphatase RsbU, regulator of sigma subunit [Treponema bryantii]|uniref:Serine phosphatase RsbU, regulator of sigma subunit n=1 Tax=Treponema bryantii TaxID=163 RepID=A0A1I3K3H0_9SPIR|nr:PP2C family protein-serine/threonine phosphatase [Treponema bryantii]SFI66860.1 Serine phosphatase RsbU, regulator of sigma subunit [Treponema bryantii]
MKNLMEMLTPNKQGSAEYISKNNYSMTCFICLVIVAQGTILALISLIDSNYAVVFSTLAYTLLMLATFIYTKITKKLNFFYVSASIMVTCLTLWFLYSGGTEGFGIIWIAVVPLFTVYLIPYTEFIILNFCVLLLLMLGLWTPLWQTEFIYDFTQVFRTRFPLVYLFELIFSVFLKHRIMKTENELIEQKDLLSSENKMAALIQKSFFRHEVSKFKRWDIASTIIPLEGISGDLYDLYPVVKEDANGKGKSTDEISEIKGLGIFDSSGHGITTGIITMLAKNIFKQEFYEGDNKELPELIEKINTRFNVEKGEVDTFLTGIFLRMKGTDEYGNGQIEFVNAGHQTPVIYRKRDESFTVINNSTLSVGAIGLTVIEPYYDAINVTMEKGDELILYTDGVINCCAPGGRRLGQQGLINILAANIDKPVDDQLNDVISDIASFKGMEPSKDDMTIMLLRYHG